MQLRTFRLKLIAIMSFILASCILAGDSCASGFTICAPMGATSEIAPQIGTSSFESLFEDIVISPLPLSNPQSKLSAYTVPASLCCRTSLSCVLMVNLEIPFCYDKFTTNYFLPDGSYGTVVNGSYKSSSGDQANLISGEYSLANGTTGNIYSNALAPNTSALPMPSQYTASGVGSAIPASALGNEITITYTTTFPGTTISPLTIPASTFPASFAEETIFLPTMVTTEVSGSTFATKSFLEVPSSATLPGSTVQGSTRVGITVAPAVSTITTTTTNPRPTSGILSSATPKKNGSSGVRNPWLRVLLVNVVLAVFLHPTGLI